MSEPDDVERLVAEIERKPPFHFCNKCGAMYEGGTPIHAGCNYVAAGTDQKPARLARIVRELLAEHQVDRECWLDPPCPESGTPLEEWCFVCTNRALRERLNKIARGEEA